MLEYTNINKELEDKIDEMQKLLLESVDMLYKAAYNEAIEDAVKVCNCGECDIIKIIRKLKK